MSHLISRSRTANIALLAASLVFLTSCGGGNSGDDSPEPPATPVTVQEADPVNPPAVVGELIPEGEQRVIATADIRAYQPNGQYAAVLPECFLTDNDNPCTLEKLPYIGQPYSTISIDNIMSRVVVTHDWMGVRFEEMLRRLPSDLLAMFAPVTSITIGSEVRPSAFSPAKGAVRLDPRTLWLSVAEKRTIATNADPRSEFGNALLFQQLYRSMIGDNYATNYSSLLDDGERSLSDLEIGLATLLYHELAHANDYVQADKLAGLSMNQTPWDAVEQLLDTRVSDQLYDQPSLTVYQSYLYGVAGVRYFNDEATEFHKGLLADFVGSAMGNEGRTDLYAYSSIREDVATLLAAAMVKYHYNVELHVGFANKPANLEESSCNDYQVAWGVRNRVASPLVTPRAEYVIDRIMTPSAARDTFIANGGLGQATPLRMGDGWCESRYLLAGANKQAPEGLEWTMVRDYE